jgi:hypothetical protein
MKQPSQYEFFWKKGFPAERLLAEFRPTAQAI